MTMSKKQKTSDMSLDELNISYNELTKRLFLLKSEFSLNKKIDKPHRLPEVRREIARVLTVLKQKESEQYKK